MGLFRFMISRSSLKWFFVINFLNKRVLFSFFLVFVFDILYFLSKTNLIGVDTVAVLFYGCSDGNFVLIDMLFFLIFNLTPLYFSAVIFDSGNIKAQYVIIRFRKKSEYYFVMETSFCIFLLIYFAVHFFSVVFYNTVFTNREVWFPIKSEILYNVTQVHYGHIVTAAVSLRFFELVFVQKFFAVAHSFLCNLTIEFIAVLVGYFFSPLVKWNLYPFGLSSISRFFLVADFFNIYIVITLLIFIVGSVILDFLMSKIGIKNLLEK